MSVLESLELGFSVALTPTNLLFVFLGVVIGTVVGVLPGLGPGASIALLLPLTFTLEPATAVIMLAGIYYGTMYGGTITSVMLNLPGEAASVVTTFDGYQMARQGRAGSALGIAAIGSFIGGTVGIIGLTVVAVPLAKFAVQFGPAEYATLTALGLVLAVYLGTGSILKSLASAALGLFVATVGQDSVSGNLRFTFDSPALFDGVDFVAVAMGLFGLGEILHSLEREEKVQTVMAKIKNVFPSRADLRQSAPAIARGSVIGFLLGILPGGGGVISSMASYAIEKRTAKDPSRFGRGAIEGVAGPETANNASSSSNFIPLLTLGIPSNIILAMIFGALLIQGITPGPRLIEQEPEVFWGLIASMYVGNVFLLALNLPLVRVFVQILRVRTGILASFALTVTMIGVYSLSFDTFDMWTVVVFGIIGWFMKKTGFQAGPFVLALVLGPVLETSFRQSMLLSGGDLGVFLTRPISAGLIGSMVLVAIIGSMLSRRRRRLAAQAAEIERAADFHLAPGDAPADGAGDAAGPAEAGGDADGDGPRPPAGAEAAPAELSRDGRRGSGAP